MKNKNHVCYSVLTEDDEPKLSHPRYLKPDLLQNKTEDTYFKDFKEI